MPKRNYLLLFSGAMALVAIACGGDSTSTTAARSPTATAAQPTQSPAPTSAQDTPTPGTTAQPTPAEGRDPVENVTPTPLVEPDPDYEAGLTKGRFSLVGWKTDFRYHTVPYFEILGAGPPRDGIQPLDNPQFVSTDEADAWLSDLEPVISFELNGVQRAYPLQILIWHEIVNDEVGGVPVAVTFCPLCNSAIVFERTVNGTVLDFGTTGNLRKSDLVMWDRQTQSWWQQLTGEAIVGVMAGNKLDFLPAPIISWQDFRTLRPDGLVLSQDTVRDTGNANFGLRYGQNPYVGYDRVDNPPFLFDGELDGRLLPKERVAAITVDGVDAAFPFSILEQEGAVNYRVNGVDVAVFFKTGTASALDRSSIGASRDVGSAAVFNAVLDSQKLTFSATGSGFTDAETGSTWNILGEAVEGPLAGQRLTKIVHGNHFWFAWGAFKPDTLIYQGKN